MSCPTCGGAMARYRGDWSVCWSCAVFATVDDEAAVADVADLELDLVRT